MVAGLIHPIKAIVWLLGLSSCRDLRSAPELIWHRSYNGSGEESHPHYVIETRDGGFLMVGETGFVEDHSADLFGED